MKHDHPCSSSCMDEDNKNNEGKSFSRWNYTSARGAPDFNISGAIKNSRCMNCFNFQLSICTSSSTDSIVSRKVN